MSWVAASLLSAFFLGCYELSIKHAVRDNAVLPVLFFANLCSASVWGVLLAFGHWAPGLVPALYRVPSLSLHLHLLLVAKSALIVVSWMCTYFAVKHLTVSLAAPIRATGPMWTLFGAVLLLAERPSGLEWLGIAVTMASFLGLSFAGRAEGVHFLRNRWVWFLVAGTLLAGLSGLYDKYLLGGLGLGAATVQCWFSIYLALFFLPLALGWKFRLWTRHEFHWRHSILALSLALLVADFLYFDALREPGALVAIVSSLRRGSTVIAFVGGIWLFRETNGLKKFPAMLGVLAGIVLTLLGRRT